MKIKDLVKILLLTAMICTVNVASQVSEIGITANLATGEVTAIKADKGLIQLKTKDGSIDVVINPDTEFKHVSPDDPTNLRSAASSTLTEISVGDYLIAQE